VCGVVGWWWGGEREGMGRESVAKLVPRHRVNQGSTC
jgi:hypothetical protein